MSAGRWFTPAEDAYIREHPNYAASVIAAVLGNGRTAKSVKNRRSKLGIRENKPRGHLYTRAELVALITERWGRMAPKQIAGDLNRSVGWIRRHANEAGLPPRAWQRSRQ